MSATKIEHLADQLTCLLGETAEVQERVHAAIRDKLEAMRRADTAAIQAATEREAEAVSDAVTLDRCRREVVARLCSVIGVPALNRHGDVPMRLLVERLPAAVRGRLVEVTDRLRASATKVAEANRTVELAGMALLAHFRTLADAFFTDDSDANTYLPSGDLGRTSNARLFSAVV